jgi:hypothetical protein
MENDYIFGTYTMKQISMIESDYYVIHFEGDFFNENGYYLFTQSQAKSIYTKLAKDLASVVQHGVQRDKVQAADLILGMTVEPVRYH